MGRPRFLHPGLIALLLLAACGGEEELLLAGDAEASVYTGGGGGSFSLSGPGKGSVTGKVVYKGRPYTRRRLDLTTEDGFCVDARAPEGLLSEDFLVGKDGELRGVIVYVKKGAESVKAPVPDEPVVLDQLNCQYIPHVAVLQVGQTLILKSSDNTSHNVHGAPGANNEFNIPMSKPGQISKTLTKTEVAKRVYCDVHGWMESWLAVLPHPFHAITGEDGTFEIKEVPEGTCLLAAWHEELGELTFEVTVKAGEAAVQEITFE
jgi:plastocyanin